MSGRAGDHSPSFQPLPSGNRFPRRNAVHSDLISTVRRRARRFQQRETEKAIESDEHLSAGWKQSARG